MYNYVSRISDCTSSSVEGRCYLSFFNYGCLCTVFQWRLSLGVNTSPISLPLFNVSQKPPPTDLPMILTITLLASSLLPWGKFQIYSNSSTAFTQESFPAHVSTWVFISFECFFKIVRPCGKTQNVMFSKIMSTFVWLGWIFIGMWWVLRRCFSGFTECWLCIFYICITIRVRQFFRNYGSNNSQGNIKLLKYTFSWLFLCFLWGVLCASALTAYTS